MGFLFGVASIVVGRSGDGCIPDFIGYGAARFSSGSQDKQVTHFVIILGVGSLFGAFHCTAWSFSFPSYAEMVLWRFSSLTMFMGVFAGGCLPVAAIIESRAWKVFYFLSLAVGVVSYIIAWIMLIILAFIQLRSLPPLAFHTVKWTTYIPHI